MNPAPANFDRDLPLWYQVAQHLRTTIFARRPGDPDRLPTEDELAGRYGVSVVTMRRALKALEEEGIIERRRRHGTFVTDRAAAPRQPLTVLGSVDAVVAQQSSLEVEVVAREEVAVPPELAGLLGIALSSPILLCSCVTHDENGRVVDTARIHYRGDRFKYSVVIRADY